VHADQIERAVLDWQRALRARHPVLRCRLLRRPAAEDDTLTWMEIYACDDAQLSIAAGTALGAELSAGTPAIAGWIDGQRHVEVFVGCAS